MFKQGDVGDRLYIIGSGSFGVYIDNRFVKSVKRGAVFGELSIIYNVNRTASVVCEAPQQEGGSASGAAILWFLDAQTVGATLRSLNKKNHKRIVHFLAGSPHFGRLAHDEQFELAQHCTIQEYNPGDTILREGEVSEWM